MLHVAVDHVERRQQQRRTERGGHRQQQQAAAAAARAGPGTMPYQAIMTSSTTKAIPKSSQCREHRRERNDQARKVDLGDQVLVADQAQARTRRPIGRTAARAAARRRWRSRRARLQRVGRLPRAEQQAEQHGEHDHRRQRLHHRPGHAEQALLVADQDLAPGQHQRELAVLPQLGQVDRHPTAAWSDQRDSLAGLRHCVVQGRAKADVVDCMISGSRMARAVAGWWTLVDLQPPSCARRRQQLAHRPAARRSTARNWR